MSYCYYRGKKGPIHKTVCSRCSPNNNNNNNWKQNDTAESTQTFFQRKSSHLSLKMPRLPNIDIPILSYPSQSIPSHPQRREQVVNCTARPPIPFSALQTSETFLALQSHACTPSVPITQGYLSDRQGFSPSLMVAYEVSLRCKGDIETRMPLTTRIYVAERG